MLVVCFFEQLNFLRYGSKGVQDCTNLYFPPHLTGVARRVWGGGGGGEGVGACAAHAYTLQSEGICVWDLQMFKTTGYRTPRRY